LLPFTTSSKKLTTFEKANTSQLLPVEANYEKVYLNNTDKTEQKLILNTHKMKQIK
jgi:hypothetical protein